ncbi:CHAP domain-containing protein [Kribbella lupini]|uniref:Peptidase C51 domain-containing protein n=1 Tax=Kribbella lupini TaxID=291602 RepID=A0ABP4NBB7_9ACTN
MILKAVAAAACLALGVLVVPPIAAARGGTSSCAPDPVIGHVALDAEQRSNLAVVVATGDQLRINVKGKVIAVMTALTESSLRNVDHGDAAGPDSRGLFQQRDGWGPLAVRMDPEGASVLFYTALINVPRWMEMDPWLAAQEVQRSAFRDGRNYRAKYAQAQELVGLSPESLCQPPPTNDTGELPGARAAVNRAMGLVGQHGYYQLCARLAANIWGRPRAGYVSAAEQWSQMVASGNAHLDRQPPLGALVFWDTGGIYGHVAVYVGAGRIVSNDIRDQFPGEGGVYLVELTAIEAEWGATYLGWAPPIYQRSAV